MWPQAKSFIRRHQTFLLTTHVFPDGDAVGSELALADLLRFLGKNVLIVNEHPLPKIYRFLDLRGVIKVYGRAAEKRIRRCDAAITVDATTPERLGKVADAIRSGQLETLCIDHHKTAARVYPLNVIDRASSASGELIYRLAKTLRVPITARMATCLFVAIATDTGWFRFSNTSPSALRVAAELVECGARADRLYAAVHESLDWPRMALLERALGTLRSECRGRIATLYVTRRMLRETGARDEDTEGFVDVPRALHGVQLILFFREFDGGTKLSIRSKGGPAVDALARRFGGGGHARAAGVILNLPIRRVMNTVLPAAKRLFENRVT